MNNLKKTIEELLSGKFRYEQPGLLFSKEKIEVTLKAGEVYRGELYFGTEDPWIYYIFQQAGCSGNRSVHRDYNTSAVRGRWCRNESG